MDLLEKMIEIHSEKYGVSGVVKDYGMVIKLIFSYNGRNYVIGIHYPLFKSLGDTALKIMDDCIEIIRQDDLKDSVYLHYWYITKQGNEMTARGVVTNHPKIADTVMMTTTPIQSIDFNDEEAVIRTRNTTYHCPLAYWNFRKQDKEPDLLPEYPDLKEKYEGKIEYPRIDSGNVLLVLSDFDEYYYHSIYCIPKEGEDEMTYDAYANVGSFQDSFLIQGSGRRKRVDLCYYPHFRNIEFYSMATGDMPLWIENIGGTVLYVDLGSWQLKLLPGQRKKVCKENAEKEKISLADGDLYPAGIMEE